MVSREKGRRTTARDEQDRKAESSMRSSFEPGSKETMANWTQFEKDFAPRKATERGMHIDVNAWQFQKAISAIPESPESASNVAIERPLQEQ
jgi:hypothetical protein